MAKKTFSLLLVWIEVGKRYIIQLLPEQTSLELLQQRRVQLSDIVGGNKALFYPAPHCTLIYNIQSSGATCTLPESEIEKTLSEVSLKFARFRLSTHLIMESSPHITLEITPESSLDAMRKLLLQKITDLSSRYWKAGTYDIKPELWPHVTLAQDIAVDRQQEAVKLLAREMKSTSFTRIIFDRLSLLVRDVDSSEPYFIQSTYELVG